MSGWKRLFRLEESSRHLSRNIDEELQFHVEGRIEHLIAAGMSEEEARAEAYREFGGIEETRQRLEKIDGRRLRRRTLGDLLSVISMDMRVAVRSYLKRPSFTLTALFIIALGIGATTTIFSVVDGVLIRRLPYREPNRLVYFDRAAHPVPAYRRWKARSTVFSSLGALTEQNLDYTGGESPERLSGMMATPEIFTILDVPTAYGRIFAPDDFEGIPQVAILGHATWRRLFGEDRSIIGQTINLSRYPAVVVGILDPGFLSPRGLTGEEVDIWLPLDVTLPNFQSHNYILEVIGRLRPGVSLSIAQTELDQINVMLAEENPDAYLDRQGNPRLIPIISLQAALTGDVETPLLLLLGAVALLLAIACANVANLVLARGTDQVHEVGLRFALGASRRRLASQLLTESATLSLTGGVLGIVIAILGVRMFTLMNPGGIPLTDRIGLDLRVLGFALGLSLITGIFFGLTPAWRTSQVDVNAALRDVSRRTTGGRRKARLRNCLVVAEISLALVLLAGAGLLFNSFMRLQAVDPGFDSDGLAVLPLRFVSDSIDEARRRSIAQQALERMASVPGVEQVAAAYTSPFLYYSGIVSGSFESDFRTDDGREIEEFTCINPVTDGYFSLLRANLRGREFVPGDELPDPIPAVISGYLSDLLFPEEEGLGRSFTTEEEGTFTVIGIVTGLRHWGLNQWSNGHIWVPWERFGAGGIRCSIIVRTAGDPAALLPTLRDAAWDIEPDLPIPLVFTMTERIAQSLVSRRFYSAIFLAFALVAIILAASGIYGSMMYSVGQRRQELGIRTALGADSGHLIRMIVGQGALLTVIGIVIGLGGALAFTRLLENMMFGISTWDIPTFLTVVALLGGVAIAASYLPARRAVQVDPVEALRYE